MGACFSHRLAVWVVSVPVLRDMSLSPPVVGQLAPHIINRYRDTALHVLCNPWVLIYLIQYFVVYAIRWHILIDWAPHTTQLCGKTQLFSPCV